jgi:hypothetical protein
MNLAPGYYWIYRFKNQQMPEIARLTKNGWDFFGGNEKMGKPHQIMYRVDDFDKNHGNSDDR